MASSPAESRFPMGEREFIFLLAMMQALQALAIDAMLPALGVISNDLGVSDPNRRQLIVGVFLIGIGLGALLPGALADRYGRRPVIFGCMAFYILPMAACAVVTEFNTLVALRGIQAVGCSGLAVVPAAIIRDRFEGDRMARLQSLIAVIFMTVPMLAPTLGQAVLLFAGWRWIFGLMALLGMVVATWAWFRLPETLRPENRQPIRPKVIAVNMSAVLTTREAIGYVLASAVMMAGIWGYINSSQQLIAEHFGAGESFPYIFGALALAMAAANLINSRIVERFGTRRVSHTGLFVFIVVAIAQVWWAHNPNQTLWQFAPLMAISMGLIGFMSANFSAIALQPFGRTAGAAASVQAFLRTMIAALAGAAIGQAYDGTAAPLAWSLLAAGVIALVLVLFSEHGRLFRRLNPPPAATPVK